MNLKHFFLGEPDWNSVQPVNPHEQEGILQDLSEHVESHTGIPLHRSSHAKRHGIAGFFGYVDQEYQHFEQTWEAYAAGTCPEEEIGQACETWHTEENRKPGWKYLFGL